jgi:hypothetical protein
MAPVDDDRSAYFHVVNQNTSTISIDIKSSVDHAKSDALLGACDVLLPNFLSARLKALHLIPIELMSKRPNLIFGNLSSYGIESHDAITDRFEGGVIGGASGSSAHATAHKKIGDVEVRAIDDRGQILVDLERAVVWLHNDGEEIRLELNDDVSFYDRIEQTRTEAI